MKILFVCLGNICRSPTAEGVFRKLVSESSLAGSLEIDSAGTVDFHAGHPPDPRSVKHAAWRGIDLSSLRARKVVAADFEHYDYVIAMDKRNLGHLLSICPDRYSSKIELLLAFADGCQLREVPDPYYGTTGDFETVLDVIEEGCKGLIKHLIRQQRARAGECADTTNSREGQRE